MQSGFPVQTTKLPDKRMGGGVQLALVKLSIGQTYFSCREWIRCFPSNEQVVVLRNEDLLTKHDTVIDIVVDCLALPGQKFIKAMKTNIGATKSKSWNPCNCTVRRYSCY